MSAELPFSFFLLTPPSTCTIQSFSFYYLRLEPMILLKIAREAAIPGRSEGGIALKCTTKYLPPTAPIDLWPGSAVLKP